jgi:hypothetical protein
MIIKQNPGFKEEKHFLNKSSLCNFSYTSYLINYFINTLRIIANIIQLKNYRIILLLIQSVPSFDVKCCVLIFVKL